MIRSIFALLLVAMALCGCVLQSHEPIYSDSQSVLALGSPGGTAVTSSRRDGQWEDDGESTKIIIVDNHYEAITESSTVALSFVPLDSRWYVMQAVETGRPPVYLLAQVKANAADVYSLACTDLKSDARLLKWIDYEGDDCFIKKDAPATDLFVTLEKMADTPSSRIAILR